MTRPIALVLVLLLCLISGHSGARPAPGSGPLPLPVVVVDPKLHPAVKSLRPGDAGRARIVAAMKGEGAGQGDFVENELLVFSDDLAAVNALAARWGGKVMASPDAAKPHLKGVPAVHLVAIDPRQAQRQAKIADLPQDLRASEKQASGRLAVSSRAGLLTLAAAAIFFTCVWRNTLPILLRAIDAQGARTITTVTLMLRLH